MSKTVRASAKLYEMTFVDFNICHVMASLRMLYSLTLTYFSRSNFNYQYLEYGESQRKTARGDIYRFQHLSSNTSLRMLYSLTLTQSFKVTYFKSIYRKLRASAKVQNMTFVEFNIFHRMASFRMLYSLTFWLYSVTCKYIFTENYLLRNDS